MRYLLSLASETFAPAVEDFDYARRAGIDKTIKRIEEENG